MTVVVVTVTQATSTITVTPTSSGGAPSPSPGSMAGIIIGSIVGGVLLVALVCYLFSRYARRKFTRVAAHDAESAHFRKTTPLARHSKRPSMSKEPLMSPASWPPLPATSRVLSSATSRLDVVLPGCAESPSSTYDLGEVSPGLAQQSLSMSSWSSLGNTSLPPQQAFNDGATAPSTSPKLQGLFVHRALQSRGRVSEEVSSAQPPPDLSQSYATALDSSGGREQSVSNTERTIVRDAEVAQRAEGGEEITEADLDTESIYSQVSASFDHSEFFSELVPRQNSPSSLPRRTPSRKQRTPAPPTDLYPVAEVPDTPMSPVGQIVFPVPTAADSSLRVQVQRSHSVSSVVDRSGAFPLLASANFGRDASPVTPVGSISSSTGGRSSSSGMFTRYPSLAPSSVALSSRSVPHAETATDWYHPPPGLAAFSPTRIGSLLPPSPSMEGRTEQRDVLPTPHTTRPSPVRHAHLREGTCRSLPEVEIRNVMQGGIAHIDVAL